MLRAWSARRPAGRPDTLRLSADLVATAGARMLFFVTDNPDGTHTGEIFVPQAGAWYHQEHLLAGRRGRLRAALLGAYEWRSEAWGMFVHAEAALGHVHVAVEAGGMSTAWGARELSLSVGYQP